MGINLKDIMKPEYDQLIIDKQKVLMKRLIVIAIITFILIVGLLVVMTILNTVNEKTKGRANLLAPDMINLSARVLEVGRQNKSNPEENPLVGRSLEVIEKNNKEKTGPITLGGEEYRYGYYYLTAEEVNSIMISLNLKEESYIVNYTTGDVVNYLGLKRGNKIYYTLDDIRAIYENKKPVSEYTINISSAEDMEKLRTYPDANFKLSANIDMSLYSKGDGWKPVDRFNGSIEGRGYTISNLKISRTNQAYCGLFGQVSSSSKISNIIIENADIKGGEYTGALAGYCSGNVTGCSVRNSEINGSSKSTGGLVGAYEQGKIMNSYIVGSTITGSEAAGGLVGTLYSGTIEKCYSSANIVGIDTVGGLIGKVKPNGYSNVNESYADVKINGRKALGGMIGTVEIIKNDTLELINLYAKGAIQSGEEALGGVIGNLYMLTDSTIKFDSIYTVVDVVPEVEKRGGFVGESSNLIGTNISVIECFWEKDPLIDISLATVGGSNENTIKLAFVPKTPLEMKTKITYGKWDIEVWRLDDTTTTPYFRWQ